MKLLRGYGAGARGCKAALRRTRAVAAALALGLLAGWAPLAPTAAAAEDAPVQILALGDSLTQGYGLAQDDGFVPELSRWLAQQGARAEVINAGVSGDTTAGARARVAWSLTEETDAVIVALGGNDLLRGLPPEQMRANLDAILAEVRGRGLPVLLVGQRASGNYGAGYRQAFDAVFPELAQAHDALFVESWFDGLLPEGRAPEDLGAQERLEAQRRFMQADGIHPNADGVDRIVAALGPHVLKLIDRARDADAGAGAGAD